MVNDTFEEMKSGGSGGVGENPRMPGEQPGDMSDTGETAAQRH